MKQAYPLLLLIALASCTSQPKAVDVIAVTTETAQPATRQGDRTYVATIEARTETPVSFTAMGTITAVAVHEGQQVARGQLLATLDPTQARGTLDAARAALAQADDAYRRMLPLHQQAAISETDWVDVQTKRQQAQATLVVAQKALDDCRLTAPVAGIVGKEPMKPGTTALPSQPVVTILDITTVRARAAVPEHEIADITTTTPATVAVQALAGEAFHATSIEKTVVANPTTHTYDILLHLPNAARRLLPGMVATATLQVNQPSGGRASKASNAITVPVQAVQQTPSGARFLWLAVAGKATRRNITTGQPVGNRIEVLTGLAQGERVITQGYQKVSEGTPVK